MPINFKERLMCGRFSRARNGLDYVEPLMGGYDPRENDPDLFRPSYNVAPTTKQPIIGPNGPRLESWGFRPAWAVARKIPSMINARLDKAGTSTWKGLWKSHRVIVPADGWYEWVSEGGKKKPFFIVPKDGKPLFFAGLSSVKPEDQPVPEGVHDGFVIVTDASAGGMVDVHDRRPLAFRADEAQEWLDPSIDFQRASHLANNTVTKSDAFLWFRVSPDVNKVGNNEAWLNEPLKE